MDNKLKLPLFEAKIVEENDGVCIISLVDCPATEIPWQKFSKHKESIKFKIDDEEKHIIKSVVMVCDTPIYRRNGDFSYYIIYSKDTIRLMSEKMLKDNTFNNIDTNHGHDFKEGVNAVEFFVKDVENNINPKGFESVPDGSLFCTYKIHNEDVWNDIKSGKFTGISLEGYFTIEDTNKYVEEQFKKDEDIEMGEIMEILSKIENKIKKRK